MRVTSRTIIRLARPDIVTVLTVIQITRHVLSYYKITLVYQGWSSLSYAVSAFNKLNVYNVCNVNTRQKTPKYCEVKARLDSFGLSPIAYITRLLNEHHLK